MDSTFNWPKTTSPNRIVDALEQNPTLTALNLERCQVDATVMKVPIAEVLKKNNTIKYLNLRNNAINTSACIYLKQILNVNTTLTHLNISQNVITVECGDHLVPAFTKNKTLVHVDLNYNQIGDMTDLGNALLSNPSLTYLDLQHTSIEEGLGRELGEALSGNRTLQYLNVSENPIGPGAATRIAQCLDNNNSLKHLILGFIGFVSQSIAIGSVLGSNSVLQTLELKTLGIDDAEAQAIVTALMRYSALTKLSLADNKIGNIGAMSLGKMLASNTSLVYVKLSQNQIGNEGAQAIGRGLAENKAVTHLELARNEIGMQGLQALLTESRLIFLEASSNKIEPVGALELAEILLKNPYIGKLNLIGNDLTRASAFERIVDILVTKPIPSEITIDGSVQTKSVVQEIKNIGAEIMAKVLSTSNITKLNLSACGIQEGGARALAEVLAHNTTLDTLILSRNQLSNSGCTAVCNALETNSFLADLDLSQNGIGDEGCVAIGEMLSKNSTLKQFSVQANSITPSGFVELGRGLLNNKTMRKLKLTADTTAANSSQNEQFEAMQTVQKLIDLIINKPLPEHLILSNLNGAKNYKIDSVIARLVRYIIASANITSLDLAGNIIGNKGVGELCTALTDNSTVKSLDISGNNIDAGGTTMIAELLCTNTALDTVTLSGNRLDNEGVKNVIDSVTKNRSLKYINLSDTSCGSKGAEAVALALQANSSISSIDLRNNTIDDEGVNALLQTLKFNNAALTVVDISLSEDLHKNSFEALLFLNKEGLSQFKRYIPSETLQMGSKSCVAYIEKLKEAKNKYRSMKIYVLGDPSSDADRLVPFLLESPVNANHKGVNIYYTSQVFENIDASIWDFNQQREYQATQNFLLSNTFSVYLVCFDLDNTERVSTHFATWLKWLQTCLVGVRAVLPLYRILLVGVHSNNNNELFVGDFDHFRNAFPALSIHDRYVRVSPQQRTGRDELVKTVTTICNSILHENTECNIPIAFSSIVPFLPSLRQSMQLVKPKKFREKLQKKQGIEVTPEELSQLLECLHFSGNVFSYKALLFLDPQLAVVALTSFMTPIAEHVLVSSSTKADLSKLSAAQVLEALRLGNLSEEQLPDSSHAGTLSKGQFREIQSLGALTEVKAREALHLNSAMLPFKETVAFLRSAGLCFVFNSTYYFPQMTPTSGTPQFKSAKRAQAGRVGIRFVVAASEYIFTLPLFSSIQTAILESLSEIGEIDFDTTKHQLRVASKEFKGELVLVLDLNQLQMHLFVCSSESPERLFNHAQQIIKSACDINLPYSSVTEGVMKDFDTMQNPPRELAHGAVVDDLVDVLIPYYSLQIKEKIGQGGFGKVKTAEFRGTTVAVKQLNIVASKVSTAVLDSFKAEIKSMKAIDSCYVVKLYGACTDPKLAIVMEYLEGGDLSTLLCAQHIDIPWDLRLSYAEEIANGIAALHSHSPLMLHCDLKAANILLDKDKKHCKLADFGLATMKSTHSKSAERGTLKWMAPEIISSRPLFSIYSDMYAFGMLLWEIASRKLPFEGAESAIVKDAIATDHETEDIPDGCPEGYSELIQQCWQLQPNSRPTAREAIAKLKVIREQLKVVA